MVEWPRSRMDQLSKDFQAFAGRFSAAATDRLDRVDGGTYFSRLYQTNRTADDEQRQIDILLGELQLAMESPVLLAAPHGTVLHTGIAEGEIGLSLGRLCVALEKCLFFGAEGSMPDFWWVLDHVSGDTDPSSAAASSAVDSGFDFEGNYVEFGSDSHQGGDIGLRGKRTPEPLAAAVRRLTRVHTGHARCRAWARGLLGMDGASAEEEMRAVAAVVQLGATSSAADDNKVEIWNSGITGSPSLEEQADPNASSSDPDAGGGGGGGSPGSNRRTAAAVAAARVAVPISEPDPPSFERPPFSQLPLWLRPGPHSASIVDDLCRFVVEFSRRLGERGLSFRPSLDHVWLNQENIAAVTTYTWPRFHRNKLRCYVRGAGLLAANGEYLPAQTDDGEGESIGGDNSGGDGGLSLIGPNGCTICRLARTTATHAEKKTAILFEVVSASAASTAVVDESDPASTDCAAAAEENGSAIQSWTPSVPAKIQGTPPAPVAQIWQLLVSTSTPPEQAASRCAYYCLGDGPLPPARGWRSTDAAEAPAPVLGFASQADGGDMTGAGGGSGELEDPARVAGGEKEEAAFFRAALRLFDEHSSGDAGVMAAGDSWASSETGGAGLRTAAAGKSVAGGASSRMKLRRKRRRPPELVRRVTRKEGQESAAQGKLAGVACGDDFDGGSDSIRDNGGARHVDVPGDVACSSADCGKDDEAFDAFKAERWRLPLPSGELLSRVERARERLQRTTEERALTLKIRRDQLQDKVAVAERDFQEVMQESTETTVERVLAARPDLLEEAEAETAKAREAAAAAASAATAAGGGGGVGRTMVPSLEELVAEKAEELRMRVHSRSFEQAARRPSFSSSSSSSSGEWLENYDQDQQTARQPGAIGATLPVVMARAGWPWPVDWFVAPLVRPPPPRDSEVWGLGLEWGAFGFGFGGEVANSGDSGDFAEGPGDGVDPPVPYSIEVAAVEVVDAEHLDEAHVEYVLRVVFHEMQEQEQGNNPGSESSGSHGTNANAIPEDNRGVTELMALATAAKGLLQRTRVLGKRLNSLCALHPQLMWELEEALRLRPGAEAKTVSALGSFEFPDPFELGTLEENVLHVHRDKLTPNFKANPPTRKLAARVGSYLSGLLHFLGLLEALGETEVRARMSRVLHEALSTCDRAGRKRRQSDFILGVRIQDIPGGRLGSGVGDEERLRVQNRRCMSCGRAIAAEFLGMRKDYFPCRYADGLFCRSYCHAEDRRVIPHRVIYHWDFVTHRVSKDSRGFLDATRFHPVFDLPKLSPKLFTEQQSLRTVRSRRKQLHLLRRAILFPADSNCITGARLFDKLLEGRTHLAVTPGLYSLEDLIGVKNGNLLDFLEETNETLIAHILDGCKVCEGRAARVCEVCYMGVPVFPFQIGTVASCPNCDGLFHAKCVGMKPRQQQQKQTRPTAARSSSKRWLDHNLQPGGSRKWLPDNRAQAGRDRKESVDQETETDGDSSGFVCPKCKSVATWAEVTGE